MANLNKDRRKQKRRINWYSKKAGFGKYVIDCRSHPCIVTEANFYYGTWLYGDISVKSLINGTSSSCSVNHCGIEPISKERAEEMAVFAKSNSWNDYLKKFHGYTDEDIAHFEELDKVWNFEKVQLDTESSGVTLPEKEKS